MRHASIDIGTNSVLLLITESSGDGCALTPVVERSTITRLGQDVDRTGRLHPEAVRRTLSCLKTYAGIIHEEGAPGVRAVSTSAARDALGVSAFLDASEKILGVRPEVIRGTVEAQLSFAGAMSGLDANGPVALFDVGGGSTEVIFGDTSQPSGGGILDARSLNIGAVRLTERHAPGADILTKQQLAAIRDDAQRGLAELSRPDSLSKAPWIGIGGTVTTLAAIHQQSATYEAALIHGLALTRSEIQGLIERLSALSLEQRQTVVGLHPKRADVIVAGAILIDALLEWADADRLTVSTRGVRWGVAIDQCRRRRGTV